MSYQVKIVFSNREKSNLWFSCTDWLGDETQLSFLNVVHENHMVRKNVGNLVIFKSVIDYFEVKEVVE